MAHERPSPLPWVPDTAAVETLVAYTTEGRGRGAAATAPPNRRSRAQPQRVFIDSRKPPLKGCRWERQANRVNTRRRARLEMSPPGIPRAAHGGRCESRVK